MLRRIESCVCKCVDSREVISVDVGSSRDITFTTGDIGENSRVFIGTAAQRCIQANSDNVFTSVRFTVGVQHGIEQ